MEENLNDVKVNESEEGKKLIKENEELRKENEELVARISMLENSLNELELKTKSENKQDRLILTQLIKKSS